MMLVRTTRSSFAAMLLTVLAPRVSHAQVAAPCVEDSPERRGGVGCSIIEKKSLPAGFKEAVFWHIDRFETLESARSAAGPANVAFEAAGRAWLVTVEADTRDHHGGHHVTQAGPLRLPQAPRHAMQVQVAAFTPGMYSVVHHHSGVEAIYVVEGEACYETPTRGLRGAKGETVVVSAGTPHRAVVLGPALRYVLAVIVHDASKPATTRMPEHLPTQLLGCR